MDTCTTLPPFAVRQHVGLRSWHARRDALGEIARGYMVTTGRVTV